MCIVLKIGKMVKNFLVKIVKDMYGLGNCLFNFLRGCGF